MAGVNLIVGTYPAPDNTHYLQRAFVMLNRLLFRLTSTLPCRLIKLDGRPYLERYYLGCWFGVTCYLHRFVSADSERHLHNHPWGWGTSLILLGDYVEEVVEDICAEAEGGVITRMVHRRWINRVNHNHFHRIHDAAPGTWTLFLHGPRVTFDDGRDKGWGFLEPLRLPAGKCTVFRSWPSATSDWWTTADSGAEVGRVPL